MTAPRCIHLSASAIAAFKACPTRYRNAYVEGLRPEDDTESQRVGTNWHKLHEVYREALSLPEGTHDTAFAAAIDHLNSVYTQVPAGFDATAWEIERTILAMSFAAYHWYYQNDPINVIATEVEFKLPLHHPKTGLPLSTDRVLRVGKIDYLARREGGLFITDYKSTSKSLDADSPFWAHLRLDSQINMYVTAAVDLISSDQWNDWLASADERIVGAMYDVWHKPTLRPSTLTQAETKTLIETKTYLGETFDVEVTNEWNETVTDPETGKESTTKHAKVLVNGQPCEVTPGKKGYAVRETPAMFGARLLADMCQRPEFYFHRREIARTDNDIRRFRGEMYNIYRAISEMRENGYWFMNEHQCHATFTCAYAGLCPHNVDVTNGHTPAGFKRIFADLTVGGEAVEI